LRMLLCGVGASVILGTGFLGTDGFVVGLLAGIAVFLGIEIMALQRWARRSGVAQPDTNTAQSKTEFEGV